MYVSLISLVSIVLLVLSISANNFYSHVSSEVEKYLGGLFNKSKHSLLYNVSDSTKVYKSSNTEYVYVENRRGKRVIDISEEKGEELILSLLKADETFEMIPKIKFIFYNKKYQYGVNFLQIPLSDFDPSKETKLITHGFQGSGYAQSVQTIKNAFLKTLDGNIFILDWGFYAQLSRPIYYSAVKNIPYVAKNVATFLNSLNKSAGLDPDHLHLIGFSLGAHLVGYVGKIAKAKHRFAIGRITGLDPAGPLKYIEPINREQGTFVDIIHTDIMMFGMSARTGHVDFFPSNGFRQPGCYVLDLGCDHRRGFIYFYMSILNKSLYKARCFNRSQDVMMGLQTARDVRGACYVSDKFLYNRSQNRMFIYWGWVKRAFRYIDDLFLLPL